MVQALKTMPEKIAQAIKHDALNMAARGAKQEHIADSLGICDGTIQQANQNCVIIVILRVGRKSLGVNRN